MGFDTFDGLPERLAHRFPGGEFAQDALPDVPARSWWPACSRTRCRDSSPNATTRSAFAAPGRRPVLVDQDRARPDRRLGSARGRCWSSTSSSTFPAGRTTNTGRGREFVARTGPDLRLPRLHRRATNRSSSGCTDGALVGCSKSRAQFSRLVSSGSASRYCCCSRWALPRGSAACALSRRSESFLMLRLSRRRMRTPALGGVGDHGVVEQRDVPPVRVDGRDRHRTRRSSGRATGTRPAWRAPGSQPLLVGQEPGGPRARQRVGQLTGLDRRVRGGLGVLVALRADAGAGRHAAVGQVRGPLEEVLDAHESWCAPARIAWTRWPRR